MIDCQVMYKDGREARYFCVQVAQFAEEGRTEFAMPNGVILSVLTDTVDKMVSLPVTVIEDDEDEIPAHEIDHRGGMVAEDDDWTGLTD